MKDLVDYIDSLKNYEKSGVPRGAGTDSREGFNLGRMRRLMERFGDPQSKFKVSYEAEWRREILNALLQKIMN